MCSIHIYDCLLIMPVVCCTSLNQSSAYTYNMNSEERKEFIQKLSSVSSFLVVISNQIFINMRLPFLSFLI
jgi:hypothetical protein